MIQANNVTVQFGGRALFERVNVTFSKGNCYGIIGANGAGKSTFLRILSGDLEPTTGEVIIPKEERMSILKQDHFQYDAYTVLDTVMMGNQRLYDVMKEKDALYEKEDFTDEDGVKASELEAEFAEMGGWEAESDVSRLIQGLGLSNDILYSEMSSLTAKEKVKVLLAQALFGKPDILLLDEPTKGMDGAFKEEFGALLRALCTQGAAVCIVSHDVEFCAQYADRCGLLFRGEVVTENAARAFFSDHYFYTTAAARIAGELGAESLIAMTDISGILRDKDDPSTLIPVIHTADALQLIESGVINGGMLPKVTCCIDAIRWGVHRVFIIDGRVPHAILIEMLTNEGIGTMFVAGQGGKTDEHSAT